MEHTIEAQDHINETAAIRSQRKSMKMILLFVLALVIVLFVLGMRLRVKNRDYAAEEARLTAILAEEQDRAQEIDELEEYVKTDAYAEEVVRKKLGLAYRNEILFRAE